MNHPQGNKILPLKVGTAATNATTHYTIDRADFNYATITVAQSAASATDSADKWAVLKIAEGDTTATSSASDIAAFVGSTASSVTSGFVIAANNVTSGPSAHRFAVDCRARKRYLFLIAQPDANNGAHYIHAELSKGAAAADTTTEQNVLQFVAG